MVRGAGVLQVDGDVVADRQAQPPPRPPGPGRRGAGRAATPFARASTRSDGVLGDGRKHSMSWNRMCDGRVCIVTGAGRGLGREYALSLAQHGAKVVVNDLGGDRDGTGADVGPAREVVDEIKATGGDAAANTDDVSTWDGAAALVQQAIDTFGHLDVLVNNAGILRDRMLFSMTEDEWDAVIRVHLKGTFAPSHHAAAYWRERSKAGEK